MKVRAALLHGYPKNEDKLSLAYLYDYVIQIEDRTVNLKEYACPYIYIYIYNYMDMHTLLILYIINMYNQQMHFNTYEEFCPQYSHQHVSVSILAIFKVMFLLREYNCG